MKGRLTLQQRLILPIILLGLITLLSNILAVFSINNVHANAGTIVDEYMALLDTAKALTAVDELEARYTAFAEAEAHLSEGFHKRLIELKNPLVDDLPPGGLREDGMGDRVEVLTQVP